MNIYLCGQKHFGAEIFRALHAAGHRIAGVSAPVPGDWKTDQLRTQAQLCGVPCMPSGELHEAHIPAGVDLIVAAYSHDFINERTRLRARCGAIGYHPSLLPLHRGRNAIEWTIRMHERIAGGSVYWLSDRFDAGDIAAQEHVFVLPGDTASTLWRRDLSPLGVRLLVRVCADIEQGRLNRTPQNDMLATWEPAVDKEPLLRPDRAA